MQDLLLLVDRHFGIRPDTVEPLDGYEDKTYKLHTSDACWILKEHADTGHNRSRIAREDLLMKLHAEDTHVNYPQHIRTVDGGLFVSEEGKIYRVLSYLEGDFLAKVPQSASILESLGAMLGRMASRALRTEVDEGPVRPSEWDLQHLGFLRKYLPEESDPGQRSLIHYFISQFEAEVWPMRAELRSCMIHNDANDWNILVSDDAVSGLFDFGDHCYSWMVNASFPHVAPICPILTFS